MAICQEQPRGNQGAWLTDAIRKVIAEGNAPSCEIEELSHNPLGAGRSCKTACVASEAVMAAREGFISTPQ